MKRVRGKTRIYALTNAHSHMLEFEAQYESSRTVWLCCYRNVWKEYPEWILKHCPMY